MFDVLVSMPAVYTTLALNFILTGIAVATILLENKKERVDHQKSNAKEFLYSVLSVKAKEAYVPGNVAVTALRPLLQSTKYELGKDEKFCAVVRYNESKAVPEEAISRKACSKIQNEKKLTIWNNTRWGELFLFLGMVAVLGMDIFYLTL